jgi:hypothetical protein
MISTGTMTSIDIQTKEHSAGTLGIILSFDEELTHALAETLFNEIALHVRQSYSGLLIETGDTLFLTSNGEVIQDLVRRTALKQFRHGVAVVSQSRITRQLLNGVLRSSMSQVPVRVFSDTISALDWLENKTVLLQ